MYAKSISRNGDAIALRDDENNREDKRKGRRLRGHSRSVEEYTDNRCLLESKRLATSEKRRATYQITCIPAGFKNVRIPFSEGQANATIIWGMNFQFARKAQPTIFIWGGCEGLDPHSEPMYKKTTSSLRRGSGGTPLTSYDGLLFSYYLQSAKIERCILQMNSFLVFVLLLPIMASQQFRSLHSPTAPMLVQNISTTLSSMTGYAL